MKKLIFVLITCFYLTVDAQQIDVDVFDNLIYVAKNKNYNAILTKTIFDDLTFTDNHKNCIKFNQSYLNLKYPTVLQNEKDKKQFFKHLIRQYQRENNYEVSFSIDLFDKQIIKDNRNQKIEVEKDIFGHTNYSKISYGVETKMTTDLFGKLTYTSGIIKANLEQNFNKKWTYSDNTGNKFTFSTQTWNKLAKKHQETHAIFFYLIRQFLE